MLKTLSDWWNQEDGNTQEPELKLAITKLMVGMMHMDGETEEEHAEIVKQLGEKFDLNADESAELIEQAKDNSRDDLRFSKIVKQIEAAYPLEERTKILSKLWSIAIADGDIDFLEEQYVNRLSGLLGVPADALNALKLEQEKKFPNLNQSNRYRDPMA